MPIWLKQEILKITKKRFTKIKITPATKVVGFIIYEV